MSFAFGDPATVPIFSEDKIHFVDEQIMIMSDIPNNHDAQQNFAYVTQLRNNDGVVISLSWLTGSLSPRQSFSPAESGTYPIQVFVWESIDRPSALSPQLSVTVNVSERQT
jgi:hypothetical protein